MKLFKSICWTEREQCGDLIEESYGMIKMIETRQTELVTVNYIKSIVIFFSPTKNKDTNP